MFVYFIGQTTDDSPTILLGFVILKLDVETILNSNFHFDGGVELRVSAQCVDHNVHLFNDVI